MMPGQSNMKVGSFKFDGILASISSLDALVRDYSASLPAKALT